MEIPKLKRRRFHQLYLCVLQIARVRRTTRPFTGSCPESNPVFAGYASANPLEIVGGATGVTLGGLNVSLAYSNTRFENLGSASGPKTFRYQGTASFNNAEINAKYQFTPALVVGTAYDYTRGSGAGGRDGSAYHSFSAGIDYFLCKRTDFYTIAVFQRANGTDSLGQHAVAQITGLTPSVTD